MKLIQSFDRWLHQPAPAERLAALRIAIGGFVTVYLIANVGEFARLAEGTPETFAPVGVARLLDGPLSSTPLWLVFAALIVTGASFTAGIVARASGPIFAMLVLGWTSYHSSFGQMLHFEHLFTLHLLILAPAPTADAWALSAPALTARPKDQKRSSHHADTPSALTARPKDQKRSSHHADNHSGVRYGWPIRLLAIATATTYVLSGIAKLRLTGLAWFDPDTLGAHIGYSATRMETIGGRTPPLASWILARSWLIAPMAAAALAVELLAPLALLGRSMRNVWVGAALLFHAGTAATMLVFFGYRGLGFAMLPLFAVERLGWGLKGASGMAPRRGGQPIVTDRPA